MDAKTILQAHRVWRLFNRKGRVTETRLTKALDKGANPTSVVNTVQSAYGVNIVKDGEAYEMRATHRRGTGRHAKSTGKASGKTASSGASAAAG